VDQRIVGINGVAGQLPNVRFSGGGLYAQIRFSSPAGCLQMRPTGVTITITAKRVHATISTRDACGGSWVRRGQILGVTVGRESSRNGSAVDFQPRSGYHEYRVQVRVQGKRSVQRWLSADYSHSPPTRIYQGSDEFVNYCIDQSQTIYSLHGRLYCWSQGGLFLDAIYLKLHPTTLPPRGCWSPGA
jgi:hypothetical protein